MTENELKGELDRQFESNANEFRAELDRRFEASSQEFRTEPDRRFEADSQEFRTELDRRFNISAELTRNLVHNLADQMRTGFAELNAGFDTQAARLDRHGAMLHLGNRWTTRMGDWSEKIDTALELKGRDIAELRRHLEKLEGRLS